MPNYTLLSGMDMIVYILLSAALTVESFTSMRINRVNVDIDHLFPKRIYSYYNFL